MNNKATIKAILFDLDGTLLDTSCGIIRSVQYVINKMNLRKLSNDELLSFVGPPIKNKLKELYNISEETAIVAMNDFRKHYGMEDLYIATLYPDIFSVLSSLKENGFKLGVATYKREDQAVNLLKKYDIADMFDIIHGADFSGQMAKTDILNCCLSDLNITPQEAILVGDTENDAIGAKEIGMHFIGVTYGFGFKTNMDLEPFPNIGVATSCSELLEVIYRQSNSLFDGIVISNKTDS